MTAVCHYAIVRFVPFVETEEFANVGVVILSPDSRFFGFQLMKSRHARVTNFFDQLDGRVFRTVMREAREEFQRIAQEFKPFGTDRRFRTFDRRAAFALWSELTKPLASVLRMSEPRIAMASDPQVKLKELFAFYVERNFVTKEYQEDILERTVRGVLRKLGVADHYQHMRLGNDDYNAAFPLVASTEDERPVQVIKPLNLVYDEPTKIRDHGAAWLHRIAALKARGFLPKDVLVAVNGVEDDSRQSDARRDVISAFKQLDVAVSLATDAHKVADFVQGLIVPGLSLRGSAVPQAVDFDALFQLTEQGERPPLLLNPPNKK